MSEETVEAEQEVLPYKLVKLRRCVPNDWNPNVLDGDNYEKLKNGIKRLLRHKRHMPIIVRKHPEEKGKYQIIDGFHRWKAYGELEQKRIGVFVIKADDATARILTNTLNYLRGTPDRKKYAQSVIDLIGMGVKQKDLADLLPETEEDIDQLIDEGNVSVETFAQLKEEDEARLTDLEKSDHDEVWIDLKFKVSADAAKVIEQEITRIADAVKGKNRRGRALELMAVQSSQSDLPSDLK